MFIEIDEKCIELLNDEKNIYFFNELAYNYNNGQHYVFMSKKMLEILYNNDKIENIPRMIYKKIFDNSSEHLMIKKSVSYKIRVTDESKSEVKHGENEIIIPYSIALEIGLFTNKSNIIGENVSDCKFYILLAELYKVKTNIVGINTNLSINNGGGDSISNVVTTKEESREISLVIADSDQKYCNASIGTTLNRLIRLDLTYSKVYPLYVHEVENLIPLAMIENYYLQSSGEESKENLIMLLRSFKFSSFKLSPLAFFDMKNGIEKSKWDSDFNYKKYWKNELDLVDFQYDEEKLINGFGPHLLRKITAYIEKKIQEDKFYLDNVDEYMDDVIEEIGKIVYSFGCAKQRNCC